MRLSVAFRPLTWLQAYLFCTFAHFRLIVCGPSFCSDVRSNPDELKVLNRPLMVYVGSSSVRQPGFISLEYQEFDVTKAEDYDKWFCKESVDVFFSEHTFEHIPQELHVVAFRLMHQFLKPGGIMRMAIPSYFDEVAVPNFKPSALDIEYGHVAFVTTRSAVETLKDAGFREVTVLEQLVYTAEGRFLVTNPYDSCAGRVRRSVRHDERNLPWLKNTWHLLNVSHYNDLGYNVLKYPMPHAPKVVSLVLEAQKEWRSGA